MENVSYALYIVVGVLIAILILSVIVFRWRTIGRYEASKDVKTEIENRADFNAEFEAYNRGLMYGTDVLSCLNKAQNNNQKYVYNNYYGTDLTTIGKDDRQEYFIDVEVTLNSPLYDDIRAYYRDETGRYQRVIGLGDDTDIKSNYDSRFFVDTNMGNNSNQFKDPIVDYYYFRNGNVYKENDTYTKIMWDDSCKSKTLYELLHDGYGKTSTTTLSGRIETNISEGVYSLLTNQDTTTAAGREETSKLSALISTVNLNNQKVLNEETPNALNNDDWWYCEWITAATDFKTRKFRCTGSEYNEDTGYIEKLVFVEYEED